MNYLYELDIHLLITINRHWTHPWLDVFFPFITDLHKGPWFFWIVVPLIFGSLLWRYGRSSLMIFVILLMALGTADLVGNHAFKKPVARARPGDGVHKEMVIVRSPYGGYSFTSNHAANMFCLAKYVSDFLPQSRVIFYPVATLVAYSRVYNGVHYPSDVLGGGVLGWLIGWMYSYFAKILFEKLRNRRETQ